MNREAGSNPFLDEEERGKADHYPPGEDLEDFNDGEPLAHAPHPPFTI